MNLNSLYIPIEVKAMVVNDKVRISKNFQRWSMNYQNLNSFTSPMPAPFSGTSDWRNGPKANGVYLHWTLPEAMRTGTQHNADGRTDFPLAPNRWLVVRYSGPLNARVAAAWVVESDFVHPDDGTVPYLDPYADEVEVTSIGRKLDLSGWKEGAANRPFLAAVGPGDITFASYQPYIENVFSIHDPLTGIAEQDTLSYMVAGWYAAGSSDILANWKTTEDFTELLASLRWQVTDTKQAAHTSVCHGLVYGIAWDKGGILPVSSMPNDPGSVAVAVGNTSIDALTALIHQQVEAQGKGDEIDVQLLEAMQYDLLAKLDGPNGAELLYQAIHKAWFGPYGGGYEWVIVKKADTAGGSPYPNQGIDWNDSGLNPSWLATLNRDQQEYDNAAQEVRMLRWKLYSMWLTRGRFNRLTKDQQKNLNKNDSNFTDKNFAEQLNPETSGSLANRVKNKKKYLDDLQARIPRGASQAELQQSIAKFAAAKHLSDGYELKQAARENFYEANNPVVLLAGLNAPAVLTRDGALSCRFASSLIIGFTFNGKEITAKSIGNAIPSPDVSAIPVEVAGLIDEFFFLDPNNAKLIAEKALNETDKNTISQVSEALAKRRSYTGQLPDMVPDAWQQPWLPLYLMWEVQYYPIAQNSNGAGSWIFDGTQYSWNGKGAATTPIVLEGTTFMTPQCGFNFKKRLEDYRRKHPDLKGDALESLDSFIEQTDTWDFLSQTLEGFMDQLALRDVRSHVTPSDETLADLIGESNSIAPDLGNLPEPSGGWPKSNFQACRSGQFGFLRLNVVDRFGQSLELVTTETHLQFKPVIAPEMTPTNTVLPQEPYRFIEVRPRLLQPAKLAFDFVSNTNDDQIINLHSDVNPVCAWVMPNHVEKALSCYDPFGNELGELCAITTAGNKQVVQWHAAPNTGNNDLKNIAIRFPHLGNMLNGLISKGSEAFHNFLQTIDETLWTIDPLGARDDQNLSVLIGRPLALVRSRLQFQLDGPALTDPSWEFVFKSKTPDVVNYAFPIRLGELMLRNDGLIGYYTGDDYSQFNTVHLPQAGSITPYIKQIAPGNFIDLRFQDGSAACITMLLDPRAAVHAATAILPALAFELPARYIEPALANMAVTFRVGPLLSDINIVKAKGEGGATNGETSLVIPVPAERNGTWSWLPVKGEPLSLEDADASVHFSNIPAELRTGYLHLMNALKKN